MKRILPPPERVERDIRLLGLDPGRLDLDRLYSWAELLRKRSSAVNLIGPDEIGRLWTRHVLESLAYSLLLDSGRPVVDIGAGCGLPGVPLALMGHRVTLLEPRRKRYLFLMHAVDVTGMPAEPVRVRVEDLAPAAPDRCQFVCRAVRPPGGMSELLEGYGGRGGTLTMRRPPGAGYAGAAAVRRLPVPPLDRRGVLVQFRLPGPQGLRARKRAGSGGQ